MKCVAFFYFQDLETMSMEVVRLSKNVTPTGSPVKSAKSSAAASAQNWK